MFLGWCRYLCEISHQNEGLATPLWHQHSLFLATQASLMVVFPNRPARGTSPGATVVKLAQHSPPRLLTMPPRGAAAASSDSSSDDASSTALHPTPVCSRVGGCAPLGVLKGRLVTAQWMGLGVSVDTVPLHAPLVRMGMLAAAGDGARSVQWVSALPSHLHDAAARFFAVSCVVGTRLHAVSFTCECACVFLHACLPVCALQSQGLVGAAVRLPRVSITTALPLALLHGDMEYVLTPMSQPHVRLTVLTSSLCAALSARWSTRARTSSLLLIGWQHARVSPHPVPGIVWTRPCRCKTWLGNPVLC